MDLTNFTSAAAASGGGGKLSKATQGEIFSWAALARKIRPRFFTHARRESSKESAAT